jgi:hypothetical protein
MFIEMEWIFDGIGTAIISFILGLIGGWAAKSYRIKQIQKSGNNSTNIQIGRDFKNDRNK